MNNLSGKRTRTFPRTCVQCRAKQVNLAVIDHEMEIKHDGNVHRVMVRQLPVEKCEACGEFSIGDDGDIHIDNALRTHLGLLMPAEIREKRKALGLTQEALAEVVGCASETVSRWECGAVVQSRVFDRWLRAYFDLPSLRAYFERGAGNKDRPIFDVDSRLLSADHGSFALQQVLENWFTSIAVSNPRLPQWRTSHVNVRESTRQPTPLGTAQYPRMVNYYGKVG